MLPLLAALAGEGVVVLVEEGKPAKRPNPSDKEVGLDLYSRVRMLNPRATALLLVGELELRFIDDGHRRR